MERSSDSRASPAGFRASPARLRVGTGSVWRGEIDDGGGRAIPARIAAASSSWRSCAREEEERKKREKEKEKEKREKEIKEIRKNYLPNAYSHEKIIFSFLPNAYSIFPRINYSHYSTYSK